MLQKISVGIDLNGLQDIAAFDADPDTIVGGTIPSVVIASVKINGDIEIVAGAEATHAIAGRGWDWPDLSKHTRIPLVEILQRLQDQSSIKIGELEISPERMFASAVSALTKTRESIEGELNIVAAIPDDGRFDEDAQQQVLNASRIEGLNVQLLWRSVAAVLGLAGELKPFLSKLAGREVAVISCLEDGISVSRLVIDVDAKNSEEDYLVPKRRQPGRFFPFDRAITTLAQLASERIAEEISIKPSQIVWGDGLPLRWLLGLPDEEAIFQSETGWRRYAGNTPAWFDGLSISENLISDIDNFIEGVEFTIIEGPAVATSIAGESLNLMFHIRSALNRARELAGKKERQTLAFRGLSTNLASLGCVEFGDRQLAEKVTYLDHLPQLRLAVSRDNKAVFVPLIPEGESCEGGNEYDKQVDLGFSIASGTKLAEFYLLREGAFAPRHAEELLSRPSTTSIPIRMRVQQTPAQGRAKLTIEGLSPDHRIPPISVKWERMDILKDQTEEDLIALLEKEAIFAPPIQPHPCHSFLWVYKRRSRDLLDFSLADRVLYLSEKIDRNEAIQNVEIAETRKLLSRFQAPSALTRGWGSEKHPDTTRSRPISSDGEMPDASEGLDGGVLEAFDNVLNYLSNRITQTDLPTSDRNQIVTFCTWAFTRSPIEVRDHLRVAAERGEVKTTINDFNAMGRSFSSKDEITALFSLLDKHAGHQERLKLYHANGLFYVLSLREDAPRYLMPEQARVFVKLSLATLEQEISAQNYKAMMRTCIRAIGGLIRYRAVDPSFLSADGFLGGRANETLEKIVGHASGFPARKGVGQLAKDVLTVLREQGVPHSILTWDGDDDEIDEIDNGG